MAERKDYDLDVYMGEMAAAAAVAGGKLNRVTMFMGLDPASEDTVDTPKEQERRELKTDGEDALTAYPKAATYRIGSDVIDRINAACDRHNVQKSSFVRALLIHALDELDTGSWELPPPKASRGVISI